MSVYLLSPWRAEFVSFNVTASNKVCLHYTIAICIKYGLISEEIDAFCRVHFPNFSVFLFKSDCRDKCGSCEDKHTNRQTLTILCVYISCEENDEL